MKKAILMAVCAALCAANANAGPNLGNSRQSPFFHQPRVVDALNRPVDEAGINLTVWLQLVWNPLLGPNGAYARWIGRAFEVYDLRYGQLYLFVPKWYRNDKDFSGIGDWVGPINLKFRMNCTPLSSGAAGHP